MNVRSSLIALALRFWLPLFLASGYAVRRGGAPERLVALMLLAAAALTVIVRVEFSRRYVAVHPAVLSIDLLLFGGLLAVALRADRRWPILLTALHGVTVLGHVGKLLNPNLMTLGYATMVALPTLPGLATLVIGTWRHESRVRRFGNDPHWSV